MASPWILCRGLENIENPSQVLTISGHNEGDNHGQFPTELPDEYAERNKYVNNCWAYIEEKQFKDTVDRSATV